MKETYRKGDSLETLKSGVYQDMNTAVILNQSTVLRTNEWQRGYPMFPPGCHGPVQNLLPIANLKQLSLGKTEYTWTNLNGVYSSPLSMVPIFSPSLTINAPMSTSSQDQSYHGTQICMENTPQYCPTLTQGNIKRTMQQSFAPLHPTPFCKTANLVNPKKTARHRILSTTMPDISPRVTQTVTKTAQGYQQSVIQNIAGSINDPSSSAVKLTELSPYKEKPIPKTAQPKRQEQSQTRKRSSSWPPGCKLSKKKLKDGLTIDDQIIEEYQNLEMDVARILIRDIPFPVLSVGDKGSPVGTSFVGGGGGHATDNQAEMTAVAGGKILESTKQGSGSISRSGGMHIPSRCALESGGKKVPNENVSLWSEGIFDFNTHSTLVNVESTLLNVESTLLNVESTVMNVGNAEPENQETMSPSDGWSGHSGDEPNKQATKSVAGDGESARSEKQEATPVVTKQTKISASERVEPQKEENRSNTEAEEIVLMESGESTKSNKQAKVSPLYSGQGTDLEEQTNPLNTCCGVMQEPNKQASKPVQQDSVAPKQDTSNSETESRDLLHFENEKENYSKNTASPNKVVFTCEQCMVTFESTEDLISHTASHKSSNFAFTCNVCTQVFRSTNGLQKHIEFHEDHRNNFQCSFCFKPFSDRDSLEEHIIESHMSKRPHKCSFCPKAFRDPGSLQKHIRIHTGERPYKCTACEKSFAEYSSLRKHYRVHTGEQPYKCQYCSKAFSISGNLQRHILIHTGERPYKCSECSKTFNNPSHLRRHEKNLHSKLEREK